MFSFAAALKKLPTDVALKIINAPRPAGEYLFKQYLPEVNKPTYHTSDATMTIRSTMAGMSGMDSNFAPLGASEMSKFFENTLKLTSKVVMPESALREIQMLLQQHNGSSDTNAKRVAQEVINFFDKLIVQGHNDRREWLRARAIIDGKIDWTFGDVRAEIDYGVPAAFKPAQFTGNNKFGGSTSQFWTAIRAGEVALRYNVRDIVCNTVTLQSFIENPVNQFADVQQSGNRWTFKRWVSKNVRNSAAMTNEVSSDSRDSVSLIIYDKEAEIQDLATVGGTTVKKFIKDGEIVMIANNQRGGYTVGEGSTPNPDFARSLGYTHMAPTVEGGDIGMWGRIYTPEGAPWSLIAEGAENSLPVRQDTSATTAKTYRLLTDL